jgi:hypothetical protein
MRMPHCRKDTLTANWMLAMLVLLGLILPSAAQNPALQFRDVGPQSGLNFVPFSSMQQKYVIENIAGGVALLDCDNDGRLDIAVVNDSSPERFREGGDLMVTLYRQSGDLQFTNITKEAGLARRGWGMGLAAADYDNDGLTDLYVTGHGHNVLYHNLGNCKFEDVTDKLGVAGGGFSTGAAWADYDRDGRLDLFVSRYVRTDVNHLPTDGSPGFFHRGIHVENPITMKGESDLLYHQKPDGTFEEVSEKAGVHDSSGLNGLGAVWGDYDNDGWPDLFVANDSGANYLYHNRHDGTFEEVGLLAGVALSTAGNALGSMGVDWGDFDRDGLLDLVVTNYADQEKDLYWNQGKGVFTDITYAAKIGTTSLPYVSWGTGFADLDNDGWPDIVIASGHIVPGVDTIPNEVRYREPLLLYRNKGNRVFEEAASAAGLNSGPQQSRRGVVFGDLNNDGQVDMVVFNVGAPPSLFVNLTHNANHRVLFKLTGARSNREAVGARVTLSSKSGTQIEEIRAGGSYISSNDPRLQFGLGPDVVMEKVEIRWPNGNTEALNNLAADAIYEIAEGKGLQKTTRLEAPLAAGPR